jgi:hypothetical protein
MPEARPRQCGKRRRNSLILCAYQLAVRIVKGRQPKRAQVPEITELNCYNRYFRQQKYAHPNQRLYAPVMRRRKQTVTLVKRNVSWNIFHSSEGLLGKTSLYLKPRVHF